MAAFLYFLYFVNDDVVLKVVGTVIVAVPAGIWLFFEYRSKNYDYKEEQEQPINKFVLMARDGEHEKEWHCSGATSFLIGKGTPAQDVDIELGDTHYCEYVSDEHAVFNHSGGFWYIEDLGSVNGVGIKKKGEDYALRLKPFVAYKVDEGDVIYISKAKILVR
jgi:hypothetical protein